MSQQRLDDFDIGLDAFQQLRYVEQFSDASTLHEFAFHDFFGLAWEEF